MADITINKVKQVCECESWDCDKTIEIPLDELSEIRKKGNFIIVDGCKFGPGLFNQFVVKKDGYTLYKDTAPHNLD